MYEFVESDFGTVVIPLVWSLSWKPAGSMGVLGPIPRRRARSIVQQIVDEMPGLRRPWLSNRQVLLQTAQVIGADSPFRRRTFDAAGILLCLPLVEVLLAKTLQEEFVPELQMLAAARAGRVKVDDARGEVALRLGDYPGIEDFVMRWASNEFNLVSRLPSSRKILAKRSTGSS